MGVLRKYLNQVNYRLGVKLFFLIYFLKLLDQEKFQMEYI